MGVFTYLKRVEKITYLKNVEKFTYLKRVEKLLASGVYWSVVYLAGQTAYLPEKSRYIHLPTKHGRTAFRRGQQQFF